MSACLFFRQTRLDPPPPPLWAVVCKQTWVRLHPATSNLIQQKKRTEGDLFPFVWLDWWAVKCRQTAAPFTANC